jgi:hypothetical protein
MMVRANAEELLHQSARLMADASEGHAVLSFEFETPEKSGNGTVEVWGRRDVGPNGEPAFRIELLDVSEDKRDMIGSVAVSDGSKLSIWRADENIVYVGTVEEMKARMKEGHDQELTGYDLPDYDEEDIPQTPEEAVEKALEYFEAQRMGTVEINDMTANLLRLAPIPEQMPDEVRLNGGFVEVALRTSDGAPLGVEFSEAAVGSGKVTASVLELAKEEDAPIFSEERFDELFTFTVPQGAEIVQLADLKPEALSVEEASGVAEFDLLVPSYLPGAARLQGVNEVRGAIVQRYRLPDGGSFTVAQGEAGAGSLPDGVEGQAVVVRGLEGMLYQDDDGTRTLLTFSDGNTKVWIGGDLSVADAIAIAESLSQS